MRAVAERVKAVARALGFDRVGIAEAGPTPGGERLRAWSERGYAGEMGFVTRRLPERLDPRRVLPGARSVIATALALPAPAAGGSEGDDSAGAPDGPRARVARYARGDDYHAVLRDRLGALGAALEPLAGAPVAWRAYADTGPVQERAWAAQAGLGWIGKNACLLDRELGSHLLLGVVLTDLALAPDAPQDDHCGACRACLDACPTGAFPAPGVLDATRCLSYATIEQRSGLPDALRPALGDWVFGCDVCQDVCPWNRRPDADARPDPLGLRARLAPRAPWHAPALAWLLSLGPEDWQRAVRRRALGRAPHRELLRNALVVAGNSGDGSLAPAVRRHAEGEDPVLAEHARWALARLEAAQATGRPGGSAGA